MPVSSQPQLVLSATHTIIQLYSNTVYKYTQEPPPSNAEAAAGAASEEALHMACHDHFADVCKVCAAAGGGGAHHRYG